MLAFTNNSRRLSPFLDMAPMLHTPHLPHLDFDVFESAVIQPGYRTTEDKNGTWVEVELPGVRKEDISVDVKGRVLTIEAHRTLHRNAFNATTESQSDGGKAGEAAEQEQSTAAIGVHSEEDVEIKSSSAASNAKQTSSSANRRRQFKVKIELGRNTDMDLMRCESYTDGVLLLFAPHITRNNGSRRIEIMDWAVLSGRDRLGSEEPWRSKKCRCTAQWKIPFKTKVFFYFLILSENSCTSISPQV